MKKLVTKLTVSSLVLSIAAILTVTSCNRTPPVMPPPTIEVTKVITKDIPICAEWVGTTDGLINATIRPQVQGFLISQNYKDGSYVKKGELLFEIDPRPFQAALERLLLSSRKSAGNITLHGMNSNGFVPLLLKKL
jgi:membrane fusion protein (multidrug efflux system)